MDERWLVDRRQTVLVEEQLDTIELVSGGYIDIGVDGQRAGVAMPGSRFDQPHGKAVWPGVDRDEVTADLEAFAVIDEAWRLAKQRKLRPTREGSRSSYTVRLGRRVGYLGGRTGAARGNPPLDRVFIVFETGTQNIITAFPK